MSWFGRKMKKEEELQTIIQHPPRPLAIVPTVGVTPLGAYEKLSAELEFRPAQLLEEQIKRFLVEQNIPTYNLAEVNKYLTRIATKQGKIWIWRPLRQKDKSRNCPWTDRENGKYLSGHGSYSSSSWDYRPYDKAVPIHILRRVQKIQERFGDEVLFFVSDYAVPNPDPFIMVTAFDVSIIVFGVWDEPAFDEAGAEE